MAIELGLEASITSSPPFHSTFLRRSMAHLCLQFQNILLFLVFSTLLCQACKITVKLKSNTKEKFRIQVFVPSVKQKSEKVLFTGPEEKKLQIEGENCLEKKWIVRTWKPDGEGGWVSAKQEQAFIDGNGWLRIVVGDDLRPQMTDRLSVFCSESSLCG